MFILLFLIVQGVLAGISNLCDSDDVNIPIHLCQTLQMHSTYAQMDIIARNYHMTLALLLVDGAISDNTLSMTKEQFDAYPTNEFHHATFYIVWNNTCVASHVQIDSLSTEKNKQLVLGAVKAGKFKFLNTHT